MHGTCAEFAIFKPLLYFNGLIYMIGVMPIDCIGVIVSFGDLLKFERHISSWEYLSLFADHPVNVRKIQALLWKAIVRLTCFLNVEAHFLWFYQRNACFMVKS